MHYNAAPDASYKHSRSGGSDSPSIQIVHENANGYYIRHPAPRTRLWQYLSGPWGLSEKHTNDLRRPLRTTRRLRYPPKRILIIAFVAALLLFVLRSQVLKSGRRLKRAKGLRQASTYGRHLNGNKVVEPLWQASSEGSARLKTRTIPSEALELLGNFTPERMQGYQHWWTLNLDAYILPRRLVQSHWLEPEDPLLQDSTGRMIASWTEVMPELDHVWFNDDQAYELVLAIGNEVERAYSDMPRPILKADFWRYLSVAVLGGVYSDVDTTLLKSMTRWGEGADIWRPSGDIEPHSLVQRNIDALANAEARGVPVRDLLSSPSMILGLEADVAHLEDWTKYFARKLQIAQWTIASSPGHPILLDALQRILTVANELPIRTRNQQSEMDRIRNWRKTVVESWQKAGLTWSGPTQSDELKAMWSLDRPDEIFEPTAGTDGRPGHEDLAVLQFTGPGMFTDAVLSYLAGLGCHWTELQGIKRPLRIGDVVILPWVAFSPGWHDYWGNDPLGDQSPEALVHHHFSATWRFDRHS